MPMTAALFVVWDRDGICLKLSEALSEAMFNTTPWVSLRYGQAARVR